MCYLEPIVNVEKNGNINTFVKVTPDAVGEILKYICDKENI
jgi:hypothetical protein